MWVQFKLSSTLIVKTSAGVIFCIAVLYILLMGIDNREVNAIKAYIATALLHFSSLYEFVTIPDLVSVLMSIPCRLCSLRALLEFGCSLPSGNHKKYKNRASLKLE